LVSGTGSVSVTPSQGWTAVPGLSATINVPANSTLLISTFGGVGTTSSSTTGFSYVEIDIEVDGNQLVYTGVNPANNTSTTDPDETSQNWSMTASTAPGSGSHTITVNAVGLGVPGSSTANVSGSFTGGALLAGQLVVTVLGN
jgi:hypothetical protein